MKLRSITPMLIAKIGYIVMSVLFCAAGVIFIALPEFSSEIMGICVGIALIIFGAVKLVGYFSKDLFRLAFQYDLEFGILMIVLGAVVLINPEKLMSVICVAIGISILLDGLFKIHISMDSKKFGVKSWWVILVMAIITGVVGIALILNSVTGAKLITVLFGISLLSEGILNLYTVISTVLIVKNQLPDVIEVDSYEISEKEE